VDPWLNAMIFLLIFAPTPIAIRMALPNMAEFFISAPAFISVAPPA
jgi:hypothetical protein